MPKYTKEYLDNRKEQAEIRLAIVEAIPEDVHYHNLIIALSELLSRFTRECFKDDVLGKSTDETS